MKSLRDPIFWRYHAPPLLYPLHFYLFSGDDLSRGMLQFAKGVPLGERGLEWLKIHLVTLHGAQKKASLAERLQYAEEIMDDILDSADNPLTVSNKRNPLVKDVLLLLPIDANPSAHTVLIYNRD